MGKIHNLSPGVNLVVGGHTPLLWVQQVLHIVKYYKVITNELINTTANSLSTSTKYEHFASAEELCKSFGITEKMQVAKQKGFAAWSYPDGYRDYLIYQNFTPLGLIPYIPCHGVITLILWIHTIKFFSDFSLYGVTFSNHWVHTIQIFLQSQPLWCDFPESVKSHHKIFT